MRKLARFAVAASAAACLSLPMVFPGAVPALAQKAGANEQAPPKQVALTQKQIDGLIASQKEVRDIESKMPQDAKGPDPKIDAKIEAVVKKHGFSGMDEYSSVSYSVGVVLAGMDPESGEYIGAQAAIKKQMAEVEADKKMPPKEKKEALGELKASMESASDEKPMAGNAEIVKKNAEKLSEGMQQAD